MRKSSIDVGAPLDRYIPRRRSSNMDYSHLRLMTLSTGSMGSDIESPGAGAKAEQSIFPSPTVEQNPILNISPSVDGSHPDTGSGVFTPNRKIHRRLPLSPERRLDMPNINDDFYCKCFDWSTTGKIAVTLKDGVFNWDADKGSAVKIPFETVEEWAEESSYPMITAVTWDPEGRFLALGTEFGETLLWDSVEEKLTALQGDGVCDHVARVDSLAWISRTWDLVIFGVQSCGCIRETSIHLERHTKSFVRINKDTLHITSEGALCGLQVCPLYRYLAYSNRDGKICIWNLATETRQNQLSIEGHNATVKALSFCPWQPTILASGGGSGDCSIQGHKVTNGTKLFEIDTKSQVCCLIWCETTKELISGHGGVDMDVKIWAYPGMELLGCLRGHFGRVLSLGISPDGCTLASLSADESLYLWTIAKKKNTAKNRRGSLQIESSLPGSPLAACIR